MQNLARDEAGTVWELDAAGNPVRPVQSGPPPQGRVFSLPQNPKEARQEARQDSADDRARRDQERQEEKDRRDALEWAATHNPDGSPKPKEGADTTGTTAKIRADAIAAYQAGEAIKQRVVEMRRIHTAGPGSTRGLAGLGDYFGTKANKAFDEAGNAVRGHVGTALGFTGGQLNSVAEAQMAVGPYLPQASDYDANALAKMDRLIDVADESQKRAIAVLGGVPSASGEIKPLSDVATAKPTQRADNEVPDPTTGADLKPPPAPRTGVAGGDEREVYNERMSAQVDAMVNAGASLGMINAVMKRQGRAPIDPGSFASAKTWMKQNPGKRYYGAQVTDVEDMSLLQKAAGSDTGAFLAQMANAATAGIPAALAGPNGQGALDAMSANSPKASFAGQMVGGVAGAVGGEAALAARAPAALARYAPVIADTLFGGLTGFNSAREGEGLSGALLGAGAGVAGNLAGQAVMRGAGAVSRGVQSPPVQYLRDQGIPLTVGQTVGDSGRIGAWVKKIEDALTSVPFVGGMVDARRMEGLEGFNRAAFEAAAAPQTAVTATGAEGVGQLRQGVQDAYGRALDPVRIDANDPAFVADIAGVNAAAGRIPNVNGAQDAATASLQHRIDGAIDPLTDQMSGRGFQEAYRGLARTGRERAASDYGHEVGQVMRQGQDALGGALERQNPGAFDEFLEANAANRRMNVLAAALKPAGNQADELITPAQLNRADITSTSRLEGQIDSAAGNRPFYDLATAGQEVLPSKLPDSGTATRALIGGGLTGVLGGGGAYLGGGEGATAGVGGGLGLTLMAMLGGSRVAQRAATAALLDRPDFAVRFGDILQQQARLGGAVGTGVATQQAVGY